MAIGLIAFYAVDGLAAYIWSGRDSDVGAIMRVGGDERQRRLDRDATALSGLAMGAAAIIGAIVSAARNDGDIGGYGVICFVGGVSYALSLLVLKRRGGMSRSEFFSRAAARYLDELDAESAKRRPVLVISAETYNNSRLATVLAVVMTSNTDLATMPGSVFLPGAVTGLPKDSVVNVTAVVTLNKTDLSEQAGQAPLALLREIDRGLRHVLDL